MIRSLPRPGNIDVAARVDVAEVARDEEAVLAELGLGLLGHPPIALEHVGAADLDHPDFALRQYGAGLGVGDADLHARQRHADAARDPVAVIGVGGVHVGLGHAVALEDGVAGAGAELLVGLGRERRRARDEQAHVRHQLAGEVRPRQEARVEGRHAHHRRRLGQQAHHVREVEARQVEQRAAGHQRDVGGDEQAVGVEDRQRVQQPVIGGEAPGVAQGRRVGGEVAMAEHRTLRPAGGA